MSILRRIELLRKYIPDKLFAESNLPQIKVILKENGKEKVIAIEDASLVISSAGYIPGKPTYRASSITGTFIPLNNSFFANGIRPIITQISYNNGKMYEPLFGYPVSHSIDKIEVPDEYKYLLEKALRRNNVEFYALSKVRPLRFRCPVSKKRLISLGNTHWLFFSRARSNAEIIYNIINNLHSPFYLYLDKSNSFVRFSIYNPRGSLRPKHCSVCGIIDVEFYNDVENVFHGIYAVDVYANLKGKYIVGNSNDGWCRYSINTNDLKKYPINTDHGFSEQIYCIDKSGCRYSNYFVKIFVDGDHNDWNPVILGYEIRKTKMLSLDIKGLIRDVGSLIFNNLEQKRDLDIDNLTLDVKYRILSINAAIVNLLRHYLSHDLVISYYLTRLGFTKIDRYIDFSILINDLFTENKIALKLREQNSDDLVDDLAHYIVDKYIRSFDNKLRLTWVSLLRYVLSSVKGEKLEKYRIFSECRNDKNTRGCVPREEADEIWENIKNRISRILTNFKIKSDYWYVGAIIDIIKHTLSHHLIRTISTRWSINPSKLVEYYYEMSKDIKKISVIERDSGGIGILNRVFETWEKPDRRGWQEAVEDLILSLGKCLVGTPEDILHFALLDEEARRKLCSDRDNDIKDGVKETIRKLGIIVTPDEFEETIRLWRSLYEEAERLTRILGDEDDYKPCKLLKAVHELRYGLEKEIERFPDMNELMAYILKNMSNHGIISDLLEKILERGLKVYSDLEKELRSNLYGTNDYVKRFMKDINFILRKRIRSIDNFEKSLNTNNTIIENYNIKALRKIIECVSKRRSDDNTCKAIIYALKLLGRALRAVLIRISLLSCNGACGMCYVNTKSCGRFGAPFIQAETLDRRVLKIVASEIIKRMDIIVKDYYDVNKNVDTIAELGGETRAIRCK
ncbi:MAG: hypothetical protein ACP5NQ_00350 [Vulcanisaeta sp.]